MKSFDATASPESDLRMVLLQALRKLIRAADKKSGAGVSVAARELSDTKERLRSVEVRDAAN